MKVILSARGEFGLKLRYHVPNIHAIPGPKTVCIEPGEECLYPSAKGFIIVDRIKDDARRGTHPRTDGEFNRRLREKIHSRYGKVEVVQTRKGMPEKRFVPKPKVFSWINAKVVIAPRKRTYGRAKNWPHWNELMDLPGIFAAGAPDSSFDLPCPKAWDYDRFLDASVEAILGAELVISTCAGVAHLAMLCGTPLLLITHNGLVAPGPVLDDRGRAMESRYWPVRREEYYYKANHQNVRIHEVSQWDEPERVRDKALAILGDRHKTPEGK